jgi:hypothetical protein
MSVAALKTTAKTLILICFTVFVVLPLLFSCAFVIQDWRYTRFCWRSQSYYARMANACELLVAQAEPVEREVHHPNLQSLPGVLRDLGPDYVRINTNYVLVRLGSGVIVWAPDQSNRSWWYLQARGRRLYSRFKPGGPSPLGSVDVRFAPLFPLREPAPAATVPQR